MKIMNRYWISWYSGNYEDEGCTKPPFKFWITGCSFRPNNGLSEENLKLLDEINNEDEHDEFIDKFGRDDCTICAVIDSESEELTWELIALHFPDYRQRFCEVRDPSYQPGDRFQ